MAPKFSLQSVLDVRHGKVEILEVELGRLMAACNETEALLLSLKECQAGLWDRLGSAQSGEIDMFKIKLIRSNILDVNKRIETASLDLLRQRQEVENKRVQLVQARQSEETLKILKQNRYEVYLAEQVQIELRAQDDIYISQAFRNQQQLGA